MLRLEDSCNELTLLVKLRTNEINEAQDPFVCFAASSTVETSGIGKKRSIISIVRTMSIVAILPPHLARARPLRYNCPVRFRCARGQCHPDASYSLSSADPMYSWRQHLPGRSTFA